MAGKQVACTGRLRHVVRCISVQTYDNIIFKTQRGRRKHVETSTVGFITLIQSLTTAKPQPNQKTGKKEAKRLIALPTCYHRLTFQVRSESYLKAG